jgi:hypothetical protein
MKTEGHRTLRLERRVEALDPSVKDLRRAVEALNVLVCEKRLTPVGAASVATSDGP